MRKQLKREKVERQTSECRRVKELLQLQNLLDGLGSETARADFMSGSNGAVVSEDGRKERVYSTIRYIAIIIYTAQRRLSLRLNKAAYATATEWGRGEWGW